ncbi:hypothetical protein G6011_09917 [Alternaria panax]|uniref:Fungal STAND N-terminal Goodbye domain-containing protein n=1 Tax=Alternaria panax TaxID=48097 RepID=A0AAD4I8H8_9PLEO|nr:hypothetical protein G6011_09917 [Alternaria panax]
MIRLDRTIKSQKAPCSQSIPNHPNAIARLYCTIIPFLLLLIQVTFGNISGSKPLPIDRDLDVLVKVSGQRISSTDDDLDVTWAKVVKGFQDESKANNPNKAMTIGDVLANINAKKVDEKIKNRAKNIVSNIMDCFLVFEGVLASASSVVFPLSQQCVNALNFVIVAVKTYQKIFEDLVILLERVSVFVRTLQLDLLELVIQNNFKTVIGVARGGELFDRHGLGEYFVSQRGQHTELICADEKENRYSVLLICLQVLCEDMVLRPVDKLRYYARENLYGHLRWDTKHKLELEENEAIGRFLVKLLCSDAVIYNRSQQVSKGITRCFPSNPEKEDLIWKWFKRVGTSTGLTNLDHGDWFSKLLKKTSECRPDHWNHVIGRMIDGWCTKERDTWSVIRVIAGSRNTEALHTWLQGKSPNLDSNLLIQGLVQQFEMFYDPEEYKSWVRQKCESAFSANSDTWWALFYSAKVSTNDGGTAQNLEQALRRLTRVTDSSITILGDVGFRKHFWTEMLPLLARCQVLSNDTAGALSSYKRMMDSAESRGILEMGLLCSLMPGQIFDFFMSAKARMVPHAAHDWLYELIASIYCSEDVLSVTLAAHYGNDWSCISVTIVAVLEQLQTEIDSIDDKTANATNVSRQDMDQVRWKRNIQQEVMLWLVFSGTKVTKPKIMKEP